MAVGVSGALAGNTFIDAILAGGARWSSGSSPVSVSYALVDPLIVAAKENEIVILSQFAGDLI